MLHVPFTPPAEALHVMGDIPPLPVSYSASRMSLLRQITASKSLAPFNNYNKSRLFKTLLADLVQLFGRKASVLDITTDMLTPTALRNQKQRQWDRLWKTHLKLHSGSDGLLYYLPPHSYLTAQIPLDLAAPKDIGMVISLMLGHCKLQQHLYKLKLTFSPTCTCLSEDESCHHFLFSCPTYHHLRQTIRPQLLNYPSILRFAKESGRFSNNSCKRWLS